MEDFVPVILKILGSLFLFCKLMSKCAQVSKPDEVNRILGKSLVMRTGNFSPWQKE